MSCIQCSICYKSSAWGPKLEAREREGFLRGGQRASPPLHQLVGLREHCKLPIGVRREILGHFIAEETRMLTKNTTG